MADCADYIERLDTLKELALLDTGEEEYTDNISRTRATIAIANIPAADVAPVVHAYWIRHDDADVVEGYYVPEYECSKCRAWKKDDSDFCPDCGAKMDAR